MIALYYLTNARYDTFGEVARTRRTLLVADPRISVPHTLMLTVLAFSVCAANV